MSLGALVWMGTGFAAGAPVVEVARPEPLVADSVRSGALRRRIVHDDADIVLFYGGEQEGNLGTCGCDVRPKGSLGRVDGYVRASRAANPGVPSLLLNPGAAFLPEIASSPLGGPDPGIANRWMVEGLDMGGWDAVNLGYRDVTWAAAHAPPAAVSASFDAAAPDHLLLPAGPYTVGVTGVSGDGLAWLRPDDVPWRDPLAALAETVPALRASGADLVVVLAYEVGRLASTIATLDDVDVLIEAGAFRGRYAPRFEDGTVWVRARHQTERIGELRLFVEDGRIVAARDRLVDLDERIPTPRRFRRLERRADRELRR